MEIKIKTTEGLVDASIEIVNGIMIVSPKELPNCSNFKDGDIIVCGWSDSEWICILKGEIESVGKRYYLEDYCGIYLKGKGTDEEIWLEQCYSDSAVFVRYATEEEKKKLFDKLAEEGYEWDAEKKEIVKLKWKPKYNDNYWSLILDDTVFKPSIYNWQNSEIGNIRLGKGWVFRTEEECRAFCDKLNESINSVKP